jgi:hypothetical protein
VPVRNVLSTEKNLLFYLTFYCILDATESWLFSARFLSFVLTTYFHQWLPMFQRTFCLHLHSIRDDGSNRFLWNVSNHPWNYMVITIRKDTTLIFTIKSYLINSQLLSMLLGTAASSSLHIHPLKDTIFINPVCWVAVHCDAYDHY